MIQDRSGIAVIDRHKKDPVVKKPGQLLGQGQHADRTQGVDQVPMTIDPQISRIAFPADGCCDHPDHPDHAQDVVRVLMGQVDMVDLLQGDPRQVQLL